MQCILRIYCMVTFARSLSFEPNCARDDDYGWPRFNDASELTNNEQWTSYFLQVFGEIPDTTEYPICTFDFEVLNKTVYDTVGLNGTRSLMTNWSTLSDGDLFMSYLGSYQIFHSTWTPLPNNTWVEVTHTVYPTEMEGMWTWRTRGSGIWYNLGTTLVFPTPSDPSKIHAEAIDFLTANCSKRSGVFWPELESIAFGFCAREKGYDSIQFEPQEGEVPIGTFGVPGVTEMVLVNLDGNKTCGVDDPQTTSLRMGWHADQQCACINEPISPDCGLMPFAPLPPVLVEPPLCAAQAADPEVPCNPMTCTPTSCDVSAAGGLRF